MTKIERDVMDLKFMYLTMVNQAQNLGMQLSKDLGTLKEAEREKKRMRNRRRSRR